MRIYIPQHLRKLGIFRDLGKMVEKYASDYESSEGSFSDYQRFLKIDPVLRFVNFCISQGERSDDEYQDITNYVARLFWSVRGTKRVFDFIKRYLGIRFVGEPIYTVKTISFSIANETDWYDVALFNEYFIEFLNYLLYFENIQYKVDMDLKIVENEKFYSGYQIITYVLYKL